MPRTLWIVRHADAAPAPRGDVDFDRPLSTVGVAECASVSRWLIANGARADWMITSAARRASMTGAALAAAFGVPAERVTSDHRLYQASPRAMLEVIRETPFDVERLVVVGHNPGISELVFDLERGAFRRALPTLGIVAMRTGSDWASLGTGSAEHDTFVEPRLV